ncbi:hypothetical protein NOF55_00740 [Rhizobiaceae bacterium BDR2-2]|uniref:Uncharacterized protein n=1 Tax=Ectorhizobium quercum TaxID=2965071 RepID=A0AAE3ST00_9HYPH|nr:hypothetical protein [Ectorhizobium quercum]MCX8995630.1 hypothetical protein [Ectorhizobium quercum]
MSNTAPARKLSKTRLALAMLLPVYPLITALLYIVLPLTEGWATWQRTLLMAPVMVACIVFIVAPMVQKHFAGFIMRVV